MVEQPRKLSGLVVCERTVGDDRNFRVGSSMVEQRPFKALAVGSSPTQPNFYFSALIPQGNAD
jgi:hypothetical protein